MRDARIPEAVVKALGDCQRAHDSRVPGAAWAVLTGLYLHADRDGVCFPSIDTLQHLTGFDRSTIIRAVKWLVAHGFVERFKTKGKHNRYRLPASATSGVDATSEAGGLVAPAPSTSGVGAPELVAPAPPKQFFEQPLNTPEPRAAEERGPGDMSAALDGMSPELRAAAGRCFKRMDACADSEANA